MYYLKVSRWDFPFGNVSFHQIPPNILCMAASLIKTPPMHWSFYSSWYFTAYFSIESFTIYCFGFVELSEEYRTLSEQTIWVIYWIVSSQGTARWIGNPPHSCGLRKIQLILRNLYLNTWKIIPQCQLLSGDCYQRR